MWFVLRIWALLLLVPVLTIAELLPGLGIKIGSPICAYCCARSLSAVQLGCSTTLTASHLSLEAYSITSPECYASDTSYLTSLAYCLRTRCASENLRASELESWWEGPGPCNPAAGVNGEPVLATPKWTFAQTLNMIDQTPTNFIEPGQALNVTSLVDDFNYQFQLNSDQSAVPQARYQALYGLILMLTLMVLPIIATWISYVPGLRSAAEKLKPYFVYRPLFGTRHNQLHPWLFGYVPTFGQTLYVFIAFAMTVIFCAVSYDFAGWPNNVGPDAPTAILNWLMQRTGSYGYSILPVVILFAGRNNPLLSLTNWSHSTFMILHRWISRLWAFLAILHSILAWAWAVKNGIYSSTASTKFWSWGIVATVATVVLLVASGVPIRKWSYNIFIALHVVMTVILIVGCYYHIWLTPYGIGRYYNVSQDWLYIAIAIWGFDRTVRLAKIVFGGARRAVITEIDEETVRVDIKGVRWDSEPGKHLYIYFPTLHRLRPWENHPFSWISTALLESRGGPLSSNDAEKGFASAGAKSNDGMGDVITPAGTSMSSERSAPTAARDHGTVTHMDSAQAGGLTLFVKKSGKGTTKLLRANENLLVFIEGPYHNNEYKSALRTDRLLLIGGGIGISGLLPWLRAHPNVKLAWSVKESSRKLVEAVSQTTSSCLDKDIRIGRRLDLQQLIADEVAAGWSKVGVVVCGPGEMCDIVRTAVLEAGKTGKTSFELDVDAYSW